MLDAGFYPKKRFGQSFLIDKNIVRKIIDACALAKDDIILEIGPGKGMLTRPLAENAKKVIAVEVDKKLFGALTVHFQGVENVILFNEDILTFDLKKALKGLAIKSKVKIVANIPYSITSAIFDYLFHHIDSLDAVYLMVQKEYAQRVVAAPGSKDYSSLSCFVQYHTTPRVLFAVSARCFRPQPKVDSCFIELRPRLHKDTLAPKERELLFMIIRTAFNQRRKNIINALSSLFEKEVLRRVFSRRAFDYRLRAEHISFSEYVLITHDLKHCFKEQGRKAIV